MTVMFHELHDNHQLREDLDDDKVLGALFHEILYADDTIIYSRNPKTLSKLIQLNHLMQVVIWLCTVMEILKK